MYKISKEFHFSAAHCLDMLPPEHPCSRLHGHNYIIRVFLKSDTLNDVCFVRDYGELKPIKEYIDDIMDHQLLNEFIEVPTAENIAKHFYDTFKSFYPELYKIEVSETPKTNASYES